MCWHVQVHKGGNGTKNLQQLRVVIGGSMGIAITTY